MGAIEICLVGLAVVILSILMLVHPLVMILIIILIVEMIRNLLKVKTVELRKI